MAEEASAVERELQWITKTLERIERSLDKLPGDARELYVTKTEFEPVKRLVYGVAILILSSVVMAIIAQVVVSK